MASEHSSSGPALHEMTPATISSGLVPNPPPSTPLVPPSRTDWDILFQSMFDELLTPPPSVDLPAPKVIAPIDEVVAPVPAVSTRSPSSTTVDQDAPSLSNSQTTPKTQPLIIPNDVEEDNHDIEVAHMVSTRLQLHEQTLFCYYDAFLTAVEPKTYKDALTQSCWIEAMQEELNEFERLELWDLVPRQDKDGVIRILPPVTAAEIQAVEKERKAKNILLMAIPKEHMRRFHGMDDAKEIWEAIRTRFLKHEIQGAIKNNLQYFHTFYFSPIFQKRALAVFADEDINWQIANDAYSNEGSSIRIPGSRVRVDGKHEEIDESLYVYGKKGPQEPEPSVSDDRSSEYSTCQSNDSARSIGTSSEHSVDPEYEISRVPQEVYVSKPITTNEKGVPAPKSKENAMIERELGEGYSFTKKKCFVCGSLSHLIKDCDYYEKKMAREAEFKKQRVFNTGNGVAKPEWTNTNRINHTNQFVPRPVQLNTGRPNINSVRTNINTGRTNINYVRPRVNTVNTNVNTVRSRQPVPTRTSNSFNPKRTQDHPLKNMVDRGIFDSGCSGHMTSNKDQLEDFKEFNGGSVTFGGSKGYITGKGKIRV
ncbi:hypothetical protein Tco_1242649, partial [Tanacetum coccineum]